MDSIFKLHDKILNMKLGPDRDEEITELEEARLNMLPLRVNAGINDIGSSAHRADDSSRSGLLDTASKDDTHDVDHDDMDLDSDDFGGDGDSDYA